MNVVVSAIVDPWVTTLSFVVALAMRIQAGKKKDADARSTYALLALYRGSGLLFNLKKLNVEVKVFTSHWVVGVKDNSGTVV